MAQRAPTRRRRKIRGIPAITPIGSKRPVSETLPLAVERIVEHLRPEKIILFGSYAYGTPTPDSDVDLLVVMKTNEERLVERHWQVSRLLIPRPFPVDILVRTPQELERDLAKKHYFYYDVASRGRVLYERH
jgi:predicted nucleotidyltransferase